MLVSRPFNTISEYMTIIRGVEVGRGDTATTTSASPTVTGTGGPFADVAIGDSFSISGESVTFTVIGKASSDSITLSGNATASRSGTASWRAHRGGIGHSAVLDLVLNPLVNGSGFVIYDSTTFTN